MPYLFKSTRLTLDASITRNAPHDTVEGVSRESQRTDLNRRPAHYELFPDSCRPGNPCETGQFGGSPFPTCAPECSQMRRFSERTVRHLRHEVGTLWTTSSAVGTGANSSKFVCCHISSPPKPDRLRTSILPRITSGSSPHSPLRLLSLARGTSITMGSGSE